MARTEREQIIDEIICKYFGTTWRERTMNDGKKVYITSKTTQGKELAFAAAFDGAELLQAACYFGNGEKSVYNSRDEILTAASAGAFGSAR